MALALPIKKIGVGTAQPAGCGQVSGSHTRRELQRIDRDQLIGVRKRQRPQENAIDQTEDGRRYSNSKRQREDRSHCESWTAAKLAQGKGHILQHRRKHG